MLDRKPFDLGATLYMPILHKDVLACISGTKIPGLRSLVLCLEDALAEKDILVGLDILEKTLVKIADVQAHGQEAGVHHPLVFIRPRHLEMAARIGQMNGIEHIDGFVAPKVRPGDHTKWIDAIRGTDLLLMPTLETPEVFDVMAMSDLKAEMLSTAPERVFVLRVGGNDLMSCLGVRRSPATTLYEGPLFYVMSMLMSVMGSSGFSLTAPVFETLDDMALLAREVEKDVAFGFVGKTAIHPDQIPVIQRAFQVTAEDHDTASRMVASDAPAVFRYGGSMCEPNTHRSWAFRILDRHAIYGLKPQ